VLKLSSSSLQSVNSVGKPHNVGYVVENGLCIGCGICEAVCPNKAIELIFNVKSGMPLARVSEEKCIGCQKCLNVCYGYGVNHELNLRIFSTLPLSIVGNFERCYVGYAKDQILRYSSTSGGVVTALLAYALEQGIIDGAIVTKMEAGNPPKAKVFIATTIDEILAAGGSKYCPASFAECLRDLKKGKRYAVVGLPCHIYGIRKLAEFNTRIRNSVSLYFGILCGGMPSYLGTSYLLKNYNMEKQHIIKFEYRGGGWPGRLLIRGKKHTITYQVNVPYPQYWRDAYQFFLPCRCILCHDGFNEFSDISFGDAWLPHLNKKDKKGTSIVITRTEAGERLIQEAFQEDYVHINSISVQDIIRSQRGLIRFKYSTLRARISLCKALRKELPSFDLSRTPSSVRLNSCLSAIGLYVGRSIASKKRLWWLFNIYVSLYSFFNVAKSILQSNLKLNKIH
jgi:coenzyme F420 hydrogenase subunit beta